MSRSVFSTFLLVCCGTISASAGHAGLIEAFTEPYADIELAASEMGVLATINVKEGDTVRVGQQLATLDDSVLQAAMKVAIAGKEVQGSLQAAEAELEMQIKNLEKITGLHKRSHASQQELDSAANEVRLARARLLSVREELEVKRLECERIQAQLNRRRVRSTIDGVVTEIYRDQGEFVSPSQPTVARVVQLNPLKIIFPVPIERRGAIQQGETVDISLGANGDAAQAYVEFVSPIVDGSSSTFTVRVRLPNQDGQWQAGVPTFLHIDGPPSRLQRKIARRPNEPKPRFNSKRNR